MAKKDKETVKEDKNGTSDISKSKAKREQRKKEVAREKQRRRTAKIIGGVAAAAVVAVIAAAVGQNVYLSSMRTTPSDDFSAGLTADGRIEGVNVGDALTLVDYANIVIPADEVRATDEEVEGDINATLQSHREASTDETLEIKDGDTVNIDYVGTIDGVAFEGGDSNGAGYDLTIGSGSFIDDFEQQLIGHSPGEELTVEATFPENYRNDDTVAGKDYIIENSTVKSYPSDYLKQLRAITKYNDESMLASYNQMFSSYGMTAYENLWDMMGEDINDELSYEKDLRERAKETAKTAMVYQAIYEDAGLTIDLDAAIAELSETYGEEYMADLRATQGDGYLAQAQIQEAVMDYLMARYKTE